MPLYHFVTETFSQLIESVAIQNCPYKRAPSLLDTGFNKWKILQLSVILNKTWLNYFLSIVLRIRENNYILLQDPLELLEPLTHNIEGMHSSQTLFMSVIMSVRISCQIGYRSTLERVFKGCGFQHWMLIEWTYKTFLFVQFRTSKVSKEVSVTGLRLACKGIFWIATASISWLKVSVTRWYKGT